MKPNRYSIGLLAAFFLGLVGLSACESARDFAFGSADTQDHRAYRAVAVYTGLATVAEDDRLPILDARAFAAMEALVYGKNASSQTFETMAREVRRSFRLYAGGAGLDIPAGSIKLSAILAASQAPGVALEVLAIRRQVNAITDAGRNPTAEEWAAALDAAYGIHKRIQGGE